MIPNQNKKSTRMWITAGILVTLALGAGAFWYFYQSAGSQGLTLNPNSQGQTLALSENLESYAHDEPFFAFAYPKELTPVAFQDGEAEIVLLGGGESGTEVQIVVRAFDEPGPLTVERIQRDVPEMAIDEPQNVLIGSARIPALLFWSNDGASVGKTRELWFIYPERSRGAASYLYQVTASAEMDETLAKIMETWIIN